MAQKVQVVLVDDIDGGAAEETVAFSLDGVSYEIDLSAANAAALRETFAPYVGAARKAGARSARSARPGRRPAGRRPAAGTRSAEIRAWAREQGLAVSERGRIPADVVAKYEAAH